MRPLDQSGVANRALETRADTTKDRMLGEKDRMFGETRGAPPAREYENACDPAVSRQATISVRRRRICFDRSKSVRIGRRLKRINADRRRGFFCDNFTARHTRCLPALGYSRKRSTPPPGHAIDRRRGQPARARFRTLQTTPSPPGE